MSKQPTLSHETMNEVVEQVNDHMLWLRSSEFAESNLNALKKCIGDIHNPDLAAPLVDAINNKETIKVYGVDESNEGSHTDKEVLIKFENFSGRLTWVQYESNWDGINIDHETFTISDDHGIEHEQVAIIEAMISDHAPDLVNDIVHSNSDTLIDTPSESKLTEEQFKLACTFFNDFVQMNKA